MALPLLGLLPMIFSAVSSVSEIFHKGRETVAAITGKPSEASTPDELQAEVQNLSDDQQAKWAEAMQQELARYEAETERIEIEGGRIDPATLASYSQANADRIGYLRQTTRPWAVRMAMYFILLPVFLALVDVAQGLFAYWFVRPIGGLFNVAGMKTFDGFQSFEMVFGVSPGDVVTGAEPLNNTVAGLVYTNSVGWLTGIVVAYMGLREVGKVMGTSGDTAPRRAAPVSRAGQVLSAAGAVTDQISQIVDKVREAARKF